MLSLGDRMKEYEAVSSNRLTLRMPVIIRLDGVAFHTLTKKFNKPFDDVFRTAMKNTTKYLCENIEGCVLGYTQSDEITLVLCDYKTLETQAWFNNKVQKIVSVSASMATFIFNQEFERLVNKLDTDDEKAPYISSKDGKIRHGFFDSRCFNVPKEDVNNCLVWRQQDAIRNSILSVAQMYIDKSKFFGVNCTILKNQLLKDYNINWEDYNSHYKYGVCCVKKPVSIQSSDGTIVTRYKWFILDDTPLFTQDLEFVHSRINFE